MLTNTQITSVQCSNEFQLRGHTLITLAFRGTYKGLAPMAIEKVKILGLFWSYQLNSTANPTHFPQNWAKLAKSAVLFILCEIHMTPILEKFFDAPLKILSIVPLFCISEGKSKTLLK